MKANNTCLKCGQDQLIRIPAVSGESPRIAVGERGMRDIEIGCYVCAVCGYIEHWVENTEDVAELLKEYDGRP